MKISNQIQMEQIQLNWQWHRHNFRAMNTQVETSLYGQHPASEAILTDVQQLFMSFEKRLSRFDPNSELSQLNACEQDRFRASPILLDAVEVALLAAEATGGLYDPTILSNLEKVGYNRSFEAIENTCPYTLAPQAAPTTTPTPFHAPYQTIRLNRAAREIYKPAGVRLDLGGMGKGWTVDRAADNLQGLGPFLINAGGDIFAYHSPPGEKGWKINLIHPLKPDMHMAQLLIHHRALATSTIAKRRWRQNGRIMHHLIDPRSGQPAQTDALSVTVVTNRTVIAEVYAKSALILGVEQGLAYLQSLPYVEALIFTTDGQVVYTKGMETLLSRVEPDGFQEE